MPIKVYQSKFINQKEIKSYMKFMSVLDVKARGYKKEEERIFKGILSLLFQQPRKLSLS